MICKVLCSLAHVSIKSSVRENSSDAKKDRLEYVKSYWKVFEIYRFSRSGTQNVLCWPTMVANIFEHFEPPSKKFLATPLLFFCFKLETLLARDIFLISDQNLFVILYPMRCCWNYAISVCIMRLLEVILYQLWRIIAINKVIK